MNDLIAFLTARLDEDEAAALADGPYEWDARSLGAPPPPGASPGHGVFLRHASNAARLATTNTRDQAEHIALHGPARVLREVAADRAILAMLAEDVKDGRERDYEATEAIEQVTRIRAAVWNNHPDYRQEWKP